MFDICCWLLGSAFFAGSRAHWIQSCGLEDLRLPSGQPIPVLVGCMNCRKVPGSANFSGSLCPEAAGTIAAVPVLNFCGNNSRADGS